MLISKVADQRFMVSPDGQQADWIHPTEIPTRAPDWTDCTDLDDTAFEILMRERLASKPLLFVGV
jgi:hypothetical protein